MQVILNGNTIEVASVHMVLLDGTDMWAGAAQPTIKRGRKPKSEQSTAVTTTAPALTNEQAPRQKRGYRRRNQIEIEQTTVGNCPAHGIYNKLDDDGKVVKQIAVAIIKPHDELNTVVGFIHELYNNPKGEVKPEMTVRKAFIAKNNHLVDLVKHD